MERETGKGKLLADGEFLRRREGNQKQILRPACPTDVVRGGGPKLAGLRMTRAAEKTKTAGMTKAVGMTVRERR